MSITPSEKACLSVSRRPCPIERCDLLDKFRTLLDRQKEQILAECQAEIKKHEFQADYDRRSVRKFGEIIEPQQEELHCAQAEKLQRRDQQLLHERLLQQNSELREAHHKKSQ